MGKFQLPEDGSVLIIDEDIDEAMPLIKLLSKQGIASIYLSGKDPEMPQKPLTKIRLAFIDIQLYGPTDPESHAQTIIKILDTVIPKNNGPYIAIIWTVTSQNNIEVLTEKLKSAKNGPIDVFPLSKSIYFETKLDDSQYSRLLERIDPILRTRFEKEDLEAIRALVRNSIEPEAKKNLVKDGLAKITDELQNKLANYETFNLFTFWENLVRLASGKTVSSFSTLYPIDEYWQNNLKTGLYRLAHAQLGKTIEDTDENELIKNALKTINHSFLDIIETDINNTLELSTMIKLDRKRISLAKNIEGDKYEIIKNNKTGKYQLQINGLGMPAGDPKDAKSIDRLAGWGGTHEKNTRIELLINEFQNITVEINTRLLIDFPKLKRIQPGNVYKKSGIQWRRKRKLLESYYDPSAIIFQKNTNGQYRVSYSEIREFVFIELEVTPLCDYVERKWLKSRRLPGILVPEKYINPIDKSDSIYTNIPVVIINSKAYKPIFNFHLIKSVDIEKDENKIPLPIFRLKREVCNDIISRLSSHANRVGIVTVQ